MEYISYDHTAEKDLFEDFLITRDDLACRNHSAPLETIKRCHMHARARKIARETQSIRETIHYDASFSLVLPGPP